MDGRRVCPCCGTGATTEICAPVAHRLCDGCRHRWRDEHPTESPNRYRDMRGRNARSGKDLAVKINDRLADVLELASPGAHILEIGCAEGELGAALKSRVSVHYTGVEPSLDAEEAQRKLDAVIRGTSVDLAGGEFDLIASFHVLEHVFDVSGEVARWRQLVDDSGRILIEVPNGTGHPLLAWDFNAEHLHYFTAASLAALCQRAGLDLVRASTGHFESAVYSDSLRVVARPRIAPADQREQLLARFRSQLPGPFVVFAIGGDFHSYVEPLLDGLSVNALFDSDSRRHGIHFGTLAVAPFDLATCVGVRVLIASVRFKAEIAEWLTAHGVLPEDIVGLDDVYSDLRPASTEWRV